MAAPLSLIVVCRSFPAHRAGGLEWHAHDVVEGLMQAGHTVHVVTSPLPPEPALAPLAPNGQLVQIGRPKDGAYSRAWFRAAAPAVREIARRHGADIVHAQGLAGIPLTLTGHRLPPVVTTVHGTLFSETPLYRRTWAGLGPGERLHALWRFKHRLAFWPIWRAYLAVRPRLVVDSHFTGSELVRIDRQLRPVRIPLGVDLARYPLPPAAPRADGPPRLLTVARLERGKGIAVVLRALAPLIDLPWDYTVVGDGPERPALEELSASLGLGGRVRFTGRIGGAAPLMAEFAAADLFLNPDQGHPAFGLVNAEALLAGTPVLASDHGAHAEVLGGETGCGLVGAAADPAAWAALLRPRLGAPLEPTESRAARRDRARVRFARDRMIRRLERVYRLHLRPGAMPGAGRGL